MHENIKKYIEETGYKTLQQIRSHFQDKNEEMIDANLAYLTEKRIIRKITFQSPEKPEILYYMTPT